MEMESSGPENPRKMSAEEVSLDQTKSFILALQELKNLRPQLYSAAEYCEKSYLHSEQKQMVLENLKDYAVRALVNAVDHLGTVAYKFSDLLDKQKLDISTMDLRISCLNQQLLTCQTYMDKEGLSQQQLLAIIPRHHKHYILPNSVNKKVHFSPQRQNDARQSHLQARSRFSSGTPVTNTLSWHLASETKSTFTGTPNSSLSNEDLGTSGRSSGPFHLLDDEKGTRTKSSAAHLQLPNVGPASSMINHTLDILSKDPLHSSKLLTSFASFEKPIQRQITRAPVRSKSMMSLFFVKQKALKLKPRAVS